MGIALTMHVCNTLHHLSEDLSASALWQASVRLLFDMVEDTHSLAKLHHEMNVSPLINDFIQLHDIGMVKFRKRSDLSVHSL